MINLPKKRLFWAVGLGHLTNDIFMSMGPVLLAFLSVTILPMSNAQIGLTISLTQLVGAITQPGFGLLADRSGGRWLGAGGVLWTVSFTMLALLGAQTGVFWFMFFPFITVAIGSGAFHPVGSMHAADSDISRSASNMSYFFLLGQMGLALGPVLAGVLLDAANPNSYGLFLKPFEPVYEDFLRRPGTIAPIFFLGLLVLPAFTLMFFTLPSATNYNLRNGQNNQQSAKPRTVSVPAKAMILLIVMVALRSLAQPGSVAFIPILFQDKGWSPSQYGAITSSFWLASGIAGVFFGNLADRVDRRYVVAGSMLVSAPAFFVLPVVDGSLAFLMAIAAGGLSGASHSIIVVLAQELIPASKGFASGAILGLIFGVGALGTALIGTLADTIGLGSTFQVVAGAIVVAGVLSLLLPTSKPKAPAVIEDAEASPVVA